MIDTPAERYNRRLGLVLFAIYFVMYASFVGITVYDYRILGRPALMGLNLAIVYGFGLIIAAFVMAVIYMVMCRKEPPMNADERRFG